MKRRNAIFLGILSLISVFGSTMVAAEKNAQNELSRKERAMQLVKKYTPSLINTIRGVVALENIFGLYLLRDMYSRRANINKIEIGLIGAYCSLVTAVDVLMVRDYLKK